MLDHGSCLLCNVLTVAGVINRHYLFHEPAELDPAAQNLCEKFVFMRQLLHHVRRIKDRVQFNQFFLERLAALQGFRNVETFVVEVVDSFLEVVLHRVELDSLQLQYHLLHLLVEEFVIVDERNLVSLLVEVVDHLILDLHQLPEDPLQSLFQVKLVPGFIGDCFDVFHLFHEAFVQSLLESEFFN